MIHVQKKIVFSTLKYQPKIFAVLFLCCDSMQKAFKNSFVANSFLLGYFVASNNIRQKSCSLLIFQLLDFSESVKSSIQLKSSSAHHLCMENLLEKNEQCVFFLCADVYFRYKICIIAANICLLLKMKMLQNLFRFFYSYFIVNYFRLYEFSSQFNANQYADSFKSREKRITTFERLH